MSGNITEGFRATQLDGDLSLGRDLHLGGGVTAQGNSHFKGKVKVDGVLEADSIENRSKGLFASVEDLAAAYPDPNAGWWALVGDSLPAAMYVVENGAWVDSGGTSGSITITPEVGKDDILPRTFINANVLLNNPDEMSLDTVTTLLEDEGYSNKLWINQGTVVTFLSGEGWKNYRFLSNDPDSDIQNVNMWEEVLSGGNSAGVPTVDSLLGLMRIKPHCKKVNNEYLLYNDTFGTYEREMGIVEVTHPIFELYSKWEGFPLENVQVCLMRYVKRVGKKTRKNKKGWVKCFEKDLGLKEDWNGTILDAGFEPDIDGAIVRFKLYDMLEFIMKNYLCVQGYTREDLKNNQSLDFYLDELSPAWFGNNVLQEPTNVKKRAHFGIALRCDNPEFPTDSTNSLTTRFRGVSRYIYSDVFDIVVDVSGFMGQKIGCSFLG